MNRRFVNLLVSKMRGRGPAFNLHRIDPASLFYPTGSRKPLCPAAILEKAPAPSPALSPAPAPARLPPAAISFDWPCPSSQTGWMDFMALKNDIIAVDQEGRTLLYDGALRAVRTVNPTRDPRSSTIYVTAGDGLYVMARDPDSSPQLLYFQALIYGRPLGYCRPEDWHWRALQSPPIDCLVEGGPSYDDYSVPHPCEISAYTVVGDSDIWISRVGFGTCSFHTPSGLWSKTGEWVLPFRGRAEYVPEHDLWFGLSDIDGRLCAADLTRTPPALHDVWDDPLPPKAYIPTGVAHLLPLGSGKFCVVRFFQVSKGVKLQPLGYRHEKVAVLAGVEVVKVATTGSLHMIKHKSRRYSFGDDGVKML